jgi:hypothetical protein
LKVELQLSGKQGGLSLPLSTRGTNRLLFRQLKRRTEQLQLGYGGEGKNEDTDF